MPSSKNPADLFQFCRFLCADLRFGRQSVLNDQCWAIGPGIGEPGAVSLVSTYGLRAVRMHIFPQFSLEDLVLQDPQSFYSRPLVTFSSACFANLKFSPFPSIDVDYRVWVPDSQVLVGQVTCTNTSQLTLTVGINWRVHLQPLHNGNPMKHAQAGLNTILEGECGGLFPVFYLTGGALPSITDLPGLGHQLFLLPGNRSQLTWALASLDSIEASTLQARQYSSSSLEYEQLKIEMADKRVKVDCSSTQEGIAGSIQLSQDRAYQLLMPAIQKHPHITYVSNRSPDTGNYTSENILEVQPEWTGQTLPEVYLLSQTLLPGRPDVVKGFIQNFLKIQQSDGRIDLRSSLNHQLTGHSSLPLLTVLVSELHQYLNDVKWLMNMFPQLLGFFKSWASMDESGNLAVNILTHPLQLSFSELQPENDDDLVALWLSLVNPRNVFLLSLLYRESTELLHIAKLVNRTEGLEWLEKINGLLKAAVTEMLKTGAGEKSASSQSNPHMEDDHVLCRFKSDGLPKLKHNLVNTGKLYLRIDYPGRLPGDLHCYISGFKSDRYIEKTLNAKDFQDIGHSHLCVLPEELDFIESISVHKLPEDANGEIGLAGQQRPGILDLAALYAGIPTGGEVNRLLAGVKVKNHFSNRDITVFKTLQPGPSLTLPSFIAVMLIEGLVRYGKFETANQLFKQHFQPQKDQTITPGHYSSCQALKIEQLMPVRLFLKLHGLLKLSDREVILAHFKTKQAPVTVQYNQLELKMRHDLTEVHLQTGEVIYLNQPGINRFLLE